jgi:hypothetical protein
VERQHLAEAAYNRSLAIAALAPALCLGVIAAVLLTEACFGLHALGSEPHLILAESAALKDHATMLKLIGEGADPNRRFGVRAGSCARSLNITPLEAAIRAWSVTTVRLLV